MTVSEVLNIYHLLRNIPMQREGRELTPQTKAHVILCRAHYAREVERFGKDMREVLQTLKKEGFDERRRAIEKMQRIDECKTRAEAWKEGDTGSRPAMPSAEALSEADEIRRTKPDFDHEAEELIRQYNRACDEAAGEASALVPRFLSEEDFAQIVYVVGTEGEMPIEINGACGTALCGRFVEEVCQILVRT